MKEQMFKHEEANLLDYWRVIWKYRRSIIAIVAATSVVAVVISLVLPKSYRSEAVIIPVSSKDSGGFGGLASQISGIASIAGISLGGAANDDVSKLMAMLKSRTLTENVINRENLMPVLFKDDWDASTGSWKSNDPEDQPQLEQGVWMMKDRMKIVNDKENETIKIFGEFYEPQRSAKVVNAYLDELQKFINSNAFTMAKRNRIFTEAQLDKNKREFLEAGKEINKFYKNNEISSVEADLDVRLDSLSTNKNTSTVAPMTLAQLGMSSDSAIASDMQELMLQKAALDETIENVRVVEDVPQQVYLTYLMMRRELLAKMNALLTSQYEMAKLNESKEELAFEVIDKAVVPVEKYKPKRAKICIVFFFGALFFAIMLAFFREYVQRMRLQE